MRPDINVEGWTMVSIEYMSNFVIVQTESLAQEMTGHNQYYEREKLSCH